MSTKDPSKLCPIEIFFNDSSSVLDNIRWYGNRDLYVTFKNNGSVYKYKNVPLDEVSKLVGSESHGKYFCSNIKPNYEFEKVE